MRRFVVIGLGNFGSSVAEALHAQGHEVIVVDTSESAVDRVAARVTRAAVGDGRDIKLLERIGARKADVGIVSTGDDIAASILASMMLRDLEITEIYVKVISADHDRVMQRLGVSDTIFPEHESALSLATRISGRTLLNYVRLAPGFSVQEMAVPSSWEGKSLRDLKLRTTYRIAVVALHDVLMNKHSAVPDPDVPLTDSDTLLIAGLDEDLAHLAQLK
ncbi:MAG TPA: TrkA family potassium uptake protein [Tepidisphaeraceae bacterium]|jgi:trk system potassium uptake protein TrkA